MQNYEIRYLTLQEMEEIYEGPAKSHFPANERKPFKAIVRMNETGCYEGLGLFKKEEEDGKPGLVAYAFYVQSPDKKLRLLDYYAVMENHRGKGIGSEFLKKMQEWYKDSQGIILETEDFATAETKEERETRSRRNAFYLRNGVRETDIHLSYFAADYQIFYIPVSGAKTREQVMEELKKIYSVMFGDKVEELIKYRAVN